MQFLVKNPLRGTKLHPTATPFADLSFELQVQQLKASGSTLLVQESYTLKPC